MMAINSSVTRYWHSFVIFKYIRQIIVTFLTCNVLSDYAKLIFFVYFLLVPRFLFFTIYRCLGNMPLDFSPSFPFIFSFLSSILRVSTLLVLSFPLAHIPCLPPEPGHARPALNAIFCRVTIFVLNVVKFPSIDRSCCFSLR